MKLISGKINSEKFGSHRGRQSILRVIRHSNFSMGTTLVLSLLLLLIILFLATSLARLSAMGEKSARNERDWAIALEAAEFALNDAEADIENAISPTSRSKIFSPNSAQGFSPGCEKGDDNIYQGLCITETDAKEPIWRTIDIANTGRESPSVQFGRFTGQTMPYGAGPFPFQLPRYIIELMLDTALGKSTDVSYLYRITAIGFGADGNSQAVVQSIYRKADGD